MPPANIAPQAPTPTPAAVLSPASDPSVRGLKLSLSEVVEKSRSIGSASQKLSELAREFESGQKCAQQGSKSLANIVADIVKGGKEGDVDAMLAATEAEAADKLARLSLIQVEQDRKTEALAVSKRAIAVASEAKVKAAAALLAADRLVLTAAIARAADTKKAARLVADKRVSMAREVAAAAAITDVDLGSKMSTFAQLAKEARGGVDNLSPLMDEVIKLMTERSADRRSKSNSTLVPSAATAAMGVTRKQPGVYSRVPGGGSPLSGSNGETCQISGLFSRYTSRCTVWVLQHASP